jgi:hypothetical protein
VALLSILLFMWALSRNGMGNIYYAAAVKSGTVSWKALCHGRARSPRSLGKLYQLW